jgi:hypothetical protein
MSMPPVVEAFIEFARLYSHAVRFSDRMGAQGNRDQRDEALARKQEIEAEVQDHMTLTKTPEFMRGGRR